MRLEGALGHLPVVDLAELVACAALQTRVDRKYVVPLAALPALLAAVPAGTRALDVGGRRAFGYRSTYLDTPERDSFLLSGHGRRRRFKVRTRHYLDSGETMLEVKTGAARGQTLKQRLVHPEVGADDRLGEAGSAFVAERLHAAGFGAGPAQAYAGRLEPVLVTGYRRATLLLGGSGPDAAGTGAAPSRVTLDVDLGWTALTGHREADLDRPGIAIVETKTGSTPSAVDRLLWRAGHRPARISKYGVGMAALHPELPRLKWHRVMEHALRLPRHADHEAAHEPGQGDREVAREHAAA